MEIIENIGLITVFLLLLLSAFLFTSSPERRLPNYLFGLFLVITSIDISALFLGEFYKEFTLFNNFRIASALLQMPLFFFYVKAVCYYNFRFKASWLYHFIPFFLFWYLLHFPDENEWIYWAYKILVQLQYYLYIIGVFITLKRFKKVHLQHYAHANESYQWLLTTSVIFLIGNTFSLIRNIAGKFIPYDLPILNIAVPLFALFVICWFVIQTMRKPYLFKGVDITKASSDTIQTNKEPIAPEQQIKLERLLTYMLEEKPYLSDSINLQKLAEATNIEEKELSALINKHLDQHFFEFINSYRIQEAKDLLSDPQLNIQQIMYDVGFNSKSSFNTAFKRQTGKTPSEYRKSIN